MLDIANNNNSTVFTDCYSATFSKIPKLQTPQEGVTPAKTSVGPFNQGNECIMDTPVFKQDEDDVEGAGFNKKINLKSSAKTTIRSKFTCKQTIPKVVKRELNSRLSE